MYRHSFSFRPLSILPLPLLAGTACVTYRAEPLRTFAELATPAPQVDVVTLREAVHWLLQRNPRLVAARGRLAAAQAVAAVPTPAANPTLSVGPVWFTPAALVARSRNGFQASLGWLLPWQGTRGATDDLNAATADAARIDAVAAAREEYLGLRDELARLAMLEDRLAGEQQLSSILEEGVAAQRRMGLRAQLGALQIDLAEFDQHAQASQVDGVRARLVAAQVDVARRCGVAAARVAELPGRARPVLPVALPVLDELCAVLAEHPALARLRAAHTVAEAALRREVSRQYPNLSLGFAEEREQGVDRLSLPLGITLPLFDRNQVAIAAAQQRRAARRAEYEATVRDLLLGLRGAFAQLELQQGRFMVQQQHTERLQRAVEGKLRMLVSARSIDPAERTAALRRVQQARIDLQQTRAALFGAWAALERACGAPLLRFPGEPEPPDAVPPLPDATGVASRHGTAASNSGVGR